MHFWIGERASQFHHYGRRQRPPLYSGTFFGTGLGGNRRDKQYGQWNRRYSSAAAMINNHHHNNQPSTSSVASNNNNALSNHHGGGGGAGTSSSTSTVNSQPIHRFQTIGSAAVNATAAAATTHEQNSNRLSVAASGVSASGNSGEISPSSRRDPNGYYSSSSATARHHRSRSRERQDRSSCGGENGRHRRRRSSSSRRYRNNGNSLASSEVVTGNSITSEPRDNSFSSSDLGVQECSRTKRIGLTLCFMGFILLCTVAAKFVIEGPGIIDTSRRGQTESTAYFFLTELIFVAFAMALFFTGVACLRKRTNDYLLRQFNQHILRGTNQRGVSDDLSNSELLYDPIIINTDTPEHPADRSGIRASYPHPSHGLSSITTPIHHNCLCRHSPSHHSSSYHHHHHHHHLSTYGLSMPTAHVSRHGHGGHYMTGSSSGGSRRCPYLNNSAASAAILLQRQQPPPYHIALYLPLPGTTTAPGPESTTLTPGQSQAHDHFEIVDESELSIQVIGRESCSVSLKEEGASVDAEILAATTVKDVTDGEEFELRERDGAPETPPPSYEQFVLRL